MKISTTSVLAIAMVIGSAASALANGAEATFPAAGVVFKHEKHISIAREDLDITYEKIHVHYVFRSAAKHSLKLTIGFPMARYPMEDDAVNYLPGRTASQTDIHDYMAFKVKVNGKPLKPKLHQYAWLGDKNITLQLRKMHIPPLTFPEEVGDKTLTKLPKAIVDKLLKMKFLERDSLNFTLFPKWDYQSIYEWQQTFKPGKTDVDITYVPLTGDEPTFGEPDVDPDNGGSENYCYDDAFRKNYKALAHQEGYIEPVRVGYILKTANNWNGPIGQFNLNVMALDAKLFGFCVPTGLKPVGDGTHWVAKNFVPDRDLDMVFFYHSTE